MSLRIAIDTGGTFTDVIAIDEVTGAQLAIKTPSTPDDPSRGLINGIQEVVGGNDAQLSQILHGTTTATNAVLEHRFEGLGLLVTSRAFAISSRSRANPCRTATATPSSG